MRRGAWYDGRCPPAEEVGRENLLNISAGWDGNILVRGKTSTELLNGCLEHERSSEALHCTDDKIKL